MLFISHTYTATKLLKKLKIKKKSTYYFASVLPDIRYTTSIERTKTHVPLKILDRYFETDSDLYKGYYLHLLIDDNMGQWQFYERLRTQYPKFLQAVFKPIILNVILELYAWENLKKLPHVRLDEAFYTDYKKFGMTQLDVKKYAGYIQAMLDNFSIETATKVILSNPKLAHNKKVTKYKKIGSVVQFAPLKWYLLRKVGHIYEAFVKDLEEKMLTF